ncbi:MAG: ATP-binding protein [Bacteroidales bacterium]|nr:ATP-binding protein [Bacteroidales bacterium]
MDNNTNENMTSTQSAPKKKDLVQMTLLDKLELLIDVSENSCLSDSFFKKYKLLIKSVADELQLTPMAAVMICPFVNYIDAAVSSKDIKEFFLIKPVTLMKHSDALQTLVYRRYLTGRVQYDDSVSYQLSSQAKACFLKNQALPVVKTENLTPQEFMNRFCQLLMDCYDNCGRGIIDEEELIFEVMDMIEKNQQLAIAKNISSLNVYANDKLCLLYFCKCLAIEGKVGFTLDALDKYLEETYHIREQFSSGSHPFFKEGLVSFFSNNGLASRDIYKLTQKGCELFLSEYVIPEPKYDLKDEEHANVIYAQSITPKTLFYSAEDQKQIETLQNLLDEQQLQGIRQRLEEAHMRKGFNCLFYGTPGTGKTETALQLARMTGRDIMQVDISSMRSMWYGETEKIVKGIFESYAKFVKVSETIPILLINEADALLSVRTTIGGNNATLEKTENAIQNILLEELEKNEGIMIATTNLTCNLDSAFDRRFLYKVEFHQPTVAAKTHIWQSFLPDLNEADAQTLARGYDFSGGQIENIARKALVDHLLFGNKTEIDHIMELCKQEQISNRSEAQRKPIGFVA